MKVFLLALLVCAGDAKVFQWIGANNEWSNGANWEGGSQPGSNNVVTFPSSVSDFGTKGASITVDQKQASVGKLIFPEHATIIFDGGKLTVTGTEGPSKKWASKDAVEQNPRCPNNWGLATSNTKAPAANANHDIPCADDDIVFATSSLQIEWPENSFAKSIKIVSVTYNETQPNGGEATFNEGSFDGTVGFAFNSTGTVLPYNIHAGSFCIKAPSSICDYGDAVHNAKDDLAKKVHEQKVVMAQLNDAKERLNITIESDDLSKYIAVQQQVKAFQKAADDAQISVVGAQTALAAAQNPNNNGGITTVTPGGSGSGSSGSSDNLPLIAGAFGGALFIIILINIIIVKRRRNNAVQDVDKETEERSIISFDNPVYDGDKGAGTPKTSVAELPKPVVYDDPTPDPVVAAPTPAPTPAVQAEETELYATATAPTPPPSAFDDGLTYMEVESPPVYE